MLSFDKLKLEELMQSFYKISGIRFVLFDNDFKMLLAYPKEDCAFCRMMKSWPRTRRKCRYADKNSFKKCEKTGEPVIYRCHAGLIEAVTPLHENGQIIGYFMLGQVTDRKDHAEVKKAIAKEPENGGIDKAALFEEVPNLQYKSTEEIMAAAKIMEACTGYILYKELVTPADSRLVLSAKEYLKAHLEEPLNIGALCAALSVGRTKLYEAFKKETGLGIAEYLNRRRLHEAKKLLKTTELTVPQIAAAVGFCDYNYFSRVYKKRYGKAPGAFRKNRTV